MADSDSRTSKQSGRRPRVAAVSTRSQAARPRLQVDVVSSGGVRATGLGPWLQAAAPASARGTVAVAIVPDASVQRLNRRYRRKDKPTDVLSFPSEESIGGGRERHLGDIVIAAGVARRQAAEAGHALGTELRVLALHGLLHLLGYDHETDTGQMSRLERRLRTKGGLREGLIERGTSRPAPRRGSR